LEATKVEVLVRDFEADETVCLHLQKLQFDETRLSVEENGERERSEETVGRLVKA